MECVCVISSLRDVHAGVMLFSSLAGVRLKCVESHIYKRATKLGGHPSRPPLTPGPRLSRRISVITSLTRTHLNSIVLVAPPERIAACRFARAASRFSCARRCASILV